VSLGSFGTLLSPLPLKKKRKKGGGAFFVSFGTLSITLVFFGVPIASMFCLRKCRDDVVDCSCESAGQLLYGPRIGFLGLFDPCRSGTLGCTTSLVVVWPVIFDMPIYDGFLDVYVFCMLHVLYM
jgi:hypothetical protein